MTLLERALQAAEPSDQIETIDEGEFIELMLAWLGTKITSRQAGIALYGEWKPGSETKTRNQFASRLREFVTDGKVKIEMPAGEDADKSAEPKG